MKKISVMLLIIVTIICSGCMENGTKIQYKEDVKKAETPETSEETKEPVLVSEAVTQIYDKTENRVSNIKLAADTINGYVVNPGEVFSFNGATGERTEEKGYKLAPILMHKEHKEGVGGGVCQVSTTIYQAAKKCGLAIVERHPHEKKVVYAESGEDAAVSYGSMDLKFKNNTDSALYIEASANSENVVIDLYRKPESK